MPSRNNPLNFPDLSNNYFVDDRKSLIRQIMLSHCE